MTGPDPTIEIPAGDGRLEGSLGLVEAPVGVVVFAHGTGSGRNSPRNQAVARALRGRGLATLLLDLLTPEEELDRTNVFDVPLLAVRLLEATSELGRLQETAGLPVAYFGASTGAAAALVAAAERPETAAVVSRGGRPDLAADRLAEVRAPTLLIVGGADPVVLEMNREAAALMSSERDLVVIPGAGHLFEEPRALEEVARLAGDWFTRHMEASTAGGERS
ncbi:MAG: dienelactone hydrolase family protein [Actinomycetota bacterium]